jgi:hypothetical protein
MVMVGPTLGSLTRVGEQVIEKLDEEYRRVIQSETSAFSRAKEAMRSYVEELTKQAEAAAAASAEKQASPKTNG